MPIEQKVIWKPLPGSQTLALCCPYDQIFYEGSRGPGKTDAQLMYFRSKVGLGYGAHWKGIIFDREYKNLDDIIGKSLRWFPQFNDGAQFKRSKGDLKWVWPSGEELLFRQIQKVDEYWNFHGHEYPFIGWNELCKYPNDELYDMMMSCNRTSFVTELHTPMDKDGKYTTPDQKPLPPIKLVVFSTANPYGPGHGWVKKRFVDVADRGVPVRTTREVFNPRTQRKEMVTKTQVRLFGSYKENIYLTPEYISEIEGVKDKNKRKAWLHGDWNIVAGGALDDLWDETIHVVPRFKIPNSWKRTRAFDWGSSKPFSVGWWAIANGEDADLPGGLVFCPPRGSLIRFHEWYGGDEAAVNKGLNMSARTIARNIKEIESRLLQQGWINKYVLPGPADTAIFNKERIDVDSIAEDMAREGIEWERANKNPGTRIQGLQLLRDRLENAYEAEQEGIYFMDHCKQARALLPTLPRDPDDPDDVDSEAEDHIYDETRYMCLKGASVTATNVPLKFST
jgi:hypothetical protein